MAQPAFMTCVNNGWDGRDYLQWDTITFEAVWSGSYSYVDGAVTKSGSITGTSTFVLTRVPFDRTLEPTADGQGLAAGEFTSVRGFCECPLLLTDFFADTEGSGIITEQVNRDPGADNTYTDTCDWTFLLPDGHICEDGTQAVADVACVWRKSSSFFDSGPTVAITPALLAYAGDTYSEDYDFDILSPLDSSVIGTQTVSITVTAA